MESSRSPYAGLSPYSAADADFFFGRERERRVIVNSLDARSLTLVFGPRGAGKSSLLRAGVVRALEAREPLGEPSSGPAVVVFSDWRSDPLSRLTDEIASTIERAGGEAAPSNGGSFADTVARATHVVPELYLILDSVEDYFFYHGADPTLAVGLARVLDRREATPRVLLSVRDDALGEVARFGPQLPTLLQGPIRIGHLTREGAREAIVRPLQRYGELYGTEMEIEPLLVETVLDEVQTGGHLAPEIMAQPGMGDEPGIEMAYLQIVLTRLWEEEIAMGSHCLRLATLQGLGDAQAILRETVDDALVRLSPDEQETAADVLGFLVTPSGNRIAQTIPDLAAYSGRAEADVAQVAERLSDQRIVRFVGPATIEVFHDALSAPILAWRPTARGGRKIGTGARQVKRYTVLVVVLAVVAVVELLLLLSR